MIKICSSRHFWNSFGTLSVTALTAVAGCAQQVSPAPGAPAQAKPALQPAVIPQAAAPKVPEGGVALLPADALSSFGLAGPNRQDAEIFIVEVTGRPFTKALRARTKKQPNRPYGIQLSARTTAPIEKNDVIYASFWIRAIESKTGEAFTTFTFEQAVDPYKRSGAFNASARKEWVHIQVPFVAVDSYPAGGALMNLRLGFNPQVIDIGGITLTNFGKKTTAEALPSSTVTYEGRELESSWRKAAAERIEKIRKAPLAITVVDSAGKAVPDVQVEVAMQRHAFPFGSAVDASRLLANNADSEKYRDTIAKLFNEVVLENDLKWARWANSENERERTRKAVRWLRDKNIAVRGHALVWPSWGGTRIPAGVRTEYERLLGNYGPGKTHSDKAAASVAAKKYLRESILLRIREAAGDSALKGQLVDWDVLNEPYTNHDLMDILGQEEMVEWFKAARMADPKAKLYINDFNIIEQAGADVAHQDHFEKTIRFLIDKGAPLDGIGIQSHFGPPTAPTKILQLLDRYAALGKEMKITEFDFLSGDERLQADYTRDFMTATFSHPSVNGILMWGFWEGMHYAPVGALWRKDWTLKPNGQVWMDLVYKDWWTKESGKTNTRGQYATRGFLGDYLVTVTRGNSTTIHKFSVDKAGGKVTVKLK